MKSPKRLLSMSVLALALVLPACSESGMRADQDEAEVPAGTQLHVRLDQNLTADADGWSSGDEFQGTLDRALQVNGQVIAPEGTIVKGEFTSNIDRADASGTTATDPGAADTAKDPRVEPGRDRDADSTAGSMAGDYGKRDRLGLELKKIVINGEEYDLDTHAVPVPGMMASGSTADRGAGTGTTGADRPGAGTGTADRGTDGSKSAGDMSGHTMSQIAGQQFIFTLEEPAEFPSTANMKTE